ncbi:MAG: hypothetical protein JNK30_21115 [Phenylobacterium sp.]|nr:hypothetical protein [Phenylobacterium sp.]MBL8773901.1 hypothetical protein [Phenylobacterium sp.]
MMLSGRSNSPRATSLFALARVLQCDVGYLMGEQDVPYRTSEPTVLPDETLIGIVPLLVSGRVRLGWEDSDYSDDVDWYTSDIHSLPQYLPGAQKLFILDDESFDRVIPRGSLLHVLENLDWHGPGLRDGDLVILLRMRAEKTDQPDTYKGQEELSLRRVAQRAPDLIILETASTSARLQDEVVWEGPGTEVRDGGRWRVGDQASESLSVTGIVLRAHVHFAGPPLLGKRLATIDEADDYVNSFVHRG